MLRMVVAITLIVAASIASALGPRNVCDNEQDISAFSEIYSSQVETYEDQASIQFSVPRIYDGVWHLVTSYVVVLSQEGELLRVPLHLEFEEASVEVTMVKTNRFDDVLQFFASYTTTPGKLVFDAKYCEFRLEVGT